MDDKARAAKNAYQRAYRKRNRDKIRAIEDRYWSKKAEANQPKGEDKNVATDANDSRNN